MYKIDVYTSVLTIAVSNLELFHAPKSSLLLILLVSHFISQEETVGYD